MKKINKYTYLFVFLMMIVAACNEPITEFGFEGSFSGKIVDQSGNIVAGDITSGGFVVEALGENDQVAMVLRIKGDGTFANNKLYPQVYTVTVKGPVTTFPPVSIDLTGNKTVVQDFVVTPFLTVSAPILNGSATSTEIKVNYNIVENGSYIASTRQLYCSNIPYPNASTGSGTGYATKIVTLSAKQGTAMITGLTAGTKYFIRVGAKATGATAFNYSDQLIVTTP
ncbi:MAG: hypothetical protein A2W90_03805 [Bacteroidetes bacterium GWF2_42_66]|nr:MAG: hypothetical protein A2W92_18725 [Bacteroidetes bacterium GWA2_42_15]OFY02548.1 MAG: hypothetical protein A2W89_22045 [Bacteroidetes bacterium GWE2_42_39]OFY41353.1 MAG: hypothetical protein A2W90_03805 [Bacteroidetes bacterium GWF2_42_66]HBL75447.1 hypothetical protein [Prolixibacteraceae bacterium]HCR91460.1 hypothetical protein [Prolixibacteraceae bacterium]